VVNRGDIVNNITRACENMVESPLKELYEYVIVQFKDVYKTFPKFLTYVETIILNTVKEKLVRAWTNHFLLMGCRTAYEVESAHGKLKKYFNNSEGDLATCWEAIHKMLKDN
jgi:hypothetical protein